MKKISMLVLMLLVFASFQVVSAETISGKVAGIDAATNKLSVSTIDASGKEGKADISVSTSTAYSGVAALAELKEGQEVSIEASQDAAGGWSATTVKVAEAPKEEAAQEPAQ